MMSSCFFNNSFWASIPKRKRGSHGPVFHDDSSWISLEKMYTKQEEGEEEVMSKPKEEETKAVLKMSAEEEAQVLMMNKPKEEITEAVDVTVRRDEIITSEMLLKPPKKRKILEKDEFVEEGARVSLEFMDCITNEERASKGNIIFSDAKPTKNKCRNRRQSQGVLINNKLVFDYYNQPKKISNERSSRINLKDFPLPAELKARIEENGGKDEKLVIVKKLFESDLNANQNRFSIPLKQIINPEFLTPAEKKLLDEEKKDLKPGEEEKKKLADEKQVDVTLIEPCGHQSKLFLRRWNYPKSSSYVLVSSWNEVLERKEKNGFEVNVVVQLWSFRVNGQLWMIFHNNNDDVDNLHVTSPTSTSSTDCSSLVLN